MKNITSKKVRQLQAKRGIIWKEGLVNALTIVELKTYGDQYNLLSYWKEGKSYIFHKPYSKLYWCFTQEIWDYINI